MATKGITRGPKENKRVAKANEDDKNFTSKKKQEEKQVGMKKK